MTHRHSNVAMAAHSLHVRIGRWFEATAFGWGVVIVPFVLMAIIAAAVGVMIWSP